MDSVNESYSLRWTSKKVVITLNKNFRWIIVDSIPDAMYNANSIINSGITRNLDIIEMHVKNKWSQRITRVILTKEDLLNKNNWNKSQFPGKKLYFSIPPVHRAVLERDEKFEKLYRARKENIKSWA